MRASMKGGNKTSFKKGSRPSTPTEFAKGRTPWNKGMTGYMAGSSNPFWKGGLEFRKKRDDRRDSAYAGWRHEVWSRDGFKCKIADENCNGRIEAHHILGWTDYPELRYKVNNGITLCHAHHPRKRAEEKRLSPYFQSLVSVSSKIICNLQEA